MVCKLEEPLYVDANLKNLFSKVCSYCVCFAVARADKFMKFVLWHGFSCSLSEAVEFCALNKFEYRAGYYKGRSHVSHVVVIMEFK